MATSRKEAKYFKANVTKLPFANSIANVASSYYGRRNGNSQMLEFGRRMRDEYISRFPLMGGAVYTFQTLAANREFRVSGRPRDANRALKFLNNSRTITYDGIEERGMYQFLQRTAMDSVAVGRYMWSWDETGLEYLDPCYMNYDAEKNEWYDRWINDRRYDHKSIVLNHTIPAGRSGRFESPLLSVLPSAILEWLIREHDIASVDGRKIRDIKIVLGEELAEQLAGAIEENWAAYDGPNPESHDVLIVHTEDTESKKSASDVVASLGLSELPDRFERYKHKFAYVNELGNATGLTIRQFWNAEEATNRALEQVQQERQLSRGPGNYARVVQRKINNSGCLKQFGASVKMSFYEEVDAATKKVNAEVIEKYSGALEKFAAVFNGNVNGDALLAWLQSESILPPDLDLITDVGVMEATDRVDTPADGERIIESDVTASPGLASQNGSEEKNILGYDEVTLNQEGQIVDRRHKIFSFRNVLIDSIIKDEKIEDNYRMDVPDFKSTLKESRQRNLKLFREKFNLIKSDEKSVIPEKDVDLNDRHHRLISDLIMQEPDAFVEAM